MGDGGICVSLRAHDWQTRRQVRCKHARQRGSRPGTHASFDTGLFLKPIRVGGFTVK